MLPRSSERRDLSAARTALLVLFLCGVGCATLTLPQEQELGRQVAAQMRRELPFFGDRVTTEYVRDLADDILAAAGPQPFEYRVYVLQDEDINAFAAPAGFVYVNTGTILKARNVSELAGVIAHEIGHVAKRHVAENYNRQRTTGLVQQAGVVAAGMLGGSAMAGAADLGGGLAALTYLNSFGREAEMEADAFAVEVLPRANYDPIGLLTFFQTLRYEGGPNVPSFLSSHPTTQDRIEATRALIAALPADPGLRVNDHGKLEIIQRRILLLTGKARPQPQR